MNNRVIYSSVAAVAQAVSSQEKSTRSRILAAARKRFETFGYRRTGVAEIAREAGVAAGTLYRYFRGKEEIFLEAVREMTAGWAERADHILGEPGSAVDRLLRLGQASVEFARENALFNAILNRDLEMILAPLLDDMNAQLMRQNVARIADVIREGIAAGELRDLDPERAAYVLWTGGNALFNQPFEAYADVLPVYVDVILQGILRR
jgi:AcrR family transcriptional regulator